MKRRDFLRGLGAAFAVPHLPACEGRGAGVDFREDFTAWTWVHGNRDRDEGGWTKAFARIRASGIRGVLVGGGDGELLARVADAQGLRFHRWTWILNRSGDEWVQEHHPEWFTVSRSGRSSLEHPPYVGYYTWLCPTRAPVRAYLRGLVAEVASGPGVDAVHLDYIRHCDVILPRALWSTYGLVQDRELPDFDFCYCPVCREAFASQDGRDPLEIADPTQDEAWRRFRWDGVTRLVAELVDEVHGRGRQVSAAVFPTPAIARRLVRQAWDEWPVDHVFPMLYHSFYEEGIAWIGEGVREGLEALGGSGRTLTAGLYVPALSPFDLGRAVSAARQAGAAGVSLFEMDGLSDDHLEALSDGLA